MSVVGGEQTTGCCVVHLDRLVPTGRDHESSVTTEDDPGHPIGMHAAAPPLVTDRQPPRPRLVTGRSRRHAFAVSTDRRTEYDIVEGAKQSLDTTGLGSHQGQFTVFPGRPAAHQHSVSAGCPIQRVNPLWPTFQPSQQFSVGRIPDSHFVVPAHGQLFPVRRKCQCKHRNGHRVGPRSNRMNPGRQL